MYNENEKLPARERAILESILTKTQLELVSNPPPGIRPLSLFNEIIAELEEQTDCVAVNKPEDYRAIFEGIDIRKFYAAVGTSLGYLVAEAQGKIPDIELGPFIGMIYEHFFVEKVLLEQERLMLESMLNEEQLRILNKLSRLEGITILDLLNDVMDALGGIEGFDEENTPENQEEIFLSNVREAFIDRLLNLKLPEESRVIFLTLIYDAFPMNLYIKA